MKGKADRPLRLDDCFQTSELLLKAMTILWLNQRHPPPSALMSVTTFRSTSAGHSLKNQRHAVEDGALTAKVDVCGRCS